MKAQLQLKTPLIVDGTSYPQIAADFECDDNDVWVKGALGFTFCLPRSEVVYTMFLPDDFDFALFANNQSVWVIS